MPDDQTMSASNVTGQPAHNPGSTGHEPPRPDGALFVGYIFPAHLKPDGSLTDLQKGWEPVHLISFIFPYNPAEDVETQATHATVDQKLGRPYFTAYIYRMPPADPDLQGLGIASPPNEPNLAGVDGGGHSIFGGVDGGHSIFGGGQAGIVYLGQFHAILPPSAPEPHAGAPMVSSPPGNQ